MRARISIALVGAVALLAAACGGGGGDQSPTQAVSAASANTEEEGSAKLALTSVTTIPEELAGGGPNELELTGEGAVDYEERVGEMTLTASGAAAAQLGETRLIFDDTVIYIQTDAMEGQLPEGKSWVEFDFERAAAKLGPDVGQFNQFGNNDPAAILGYLEGATDLEEAGTEEVRGEETTHYEGEVDLEKAAEQVEDDALAESLERAVELSGTKKIPLEVWVGGDDDLIHRVRLELVAPAGQAAGEVTTEVTQEFYDFGTEVDVEVPSEDETVPLEDLLQGGAP